MSEELKTILVTGASGLVGSHLVQQLVADGKTVRALYRSSIPVFKKAEKVDWVRGDILDIVFLEDALNGVEQVYHCAAIVSFDPNHKDLLYKTNVEGTANVVNACINSNIQKLLYVSSVAALGRTGKEALIDESMYWHEGAGNSEYGKSKFLAEMEVWRGVGEGLSAVIVNPSIILGAGDWNTGSTEIFKSAYNEFPWYSEGITGFTDLNDLVKIMVMLMNSPVSAQRFIINSANSSFKELLFLIAKHFNKKPPHKKVTPLMAALVWRLEKIKSLFTGKTPFITKETAETALDVVHYNNHKLLEAFPGFSYTPLETTVKNTCEALKKKYKLP